MTAGCMADDLSAYLDGELTAAERAQVETHLRACDACRAVLADLQAARNALADLPALPAPAAVAERLKTAVAQASSLHLGAPASSPAEPRIGVPVVQASSLPEARRPQYWRWYSIAALLLLSVLGYTVYVGQSSNTQQRVAMAAPEAATHASPPATTPESESRAMQSDKSKAPILPMPPISPISPSVAAPEATAPTAPAAVEQASRLSWAGQTDKMPVAQASSLPPPAAGPTAAAAGAAPQVAPAPASPAPVADRLDVADPGKALRRALSAEETPMKDNLADAPAPFAPQAATTDQMREEKLTGHDAVAAGEISKAEAQSAQSNLQTAIASPQASEPRPSGSGGTPPAQERSLTVAAPTAPDMRSTAAASPVAHPDARGSANARDTTPASDAIVADDNVARADVEKDHKLAVPTAPGSGGFRGGKDARAAGSTAGVKTIVLRAADPHALLARLDVIIKEHAEPPAPKPASQAAPVIPNEQKELLEKSASAEHARPSATAAAAPAAAPPLALVAGLPESAKGTLSKELLAESAGTHWQYEAADTKKAAATPLVIQIRALPGQREVLLQQLRALQTESVAQARLDEAAAELKTESASAPEAAAKSAAEKTPRGSGAPRQVEIRIEVQ